MTSAAKNLLILSISGFIATIFILEFLPYRVFMEVQKIPSNQSTRGISVLGEWLHAPEWTPPPNRTYHNAESLLILIWKYGSFLERRHVRRFTENTSLSPWDNCSVKNCQLSYLDEDISEADAVVFHLHMTKAVTELPSTKGKPEQIWIFMTDESPLHTFLYEGTEKPNLISDYNDIFDWSMTYRTDSDIPVSYGRTIARHFPTKNTTKFQNRKKLVAIMLSNCSSKNHREKYVRNLKRLLGNDLDIYGRCLGGNVDACPGHFYRDCPLLSNYKFYLAFENSNCREYITEKVFWNAYEKGSVPIIMGAPKSDCHRLLPPNSFIHIDDFSDPMDLVNYLHYLNVNEKFYAKYHEWRSRYVVINEHGYFGSQSRHYCRICEALRYNSPPSDMTKYRNIGSYWNSSRDCYPYYQ